MFHRGWFLVGAQDRHLSSVATQVIQRFGVARIEPFHPGFADALCDSTRWAGCIVEHSARDEAHVIALRTRAPLLPLMVVLREGCPGLINRLQSKDIEVCVLPVQEPGVTSFVQRAFTSGFLPDEQVARLVAHLAETRGLTPREVQLLVFSLGDEPRERVRRRLGISENTLKTQIRSLLRKCAERNVDSLAKNVLRAALLTGRPPRFGTAEPVAPWLALAKGA
jgi:DNA-binding CsgD family transcriptional regulator